MKKESKKILILSAFIWIIANLHHPVTPTHFTELAMPDHIFGTSYGAMVFAMFITAPIWGSIGDQGYRKELLSLVTLLYGIVQIIFGYTESLLGIVIIRALGGAAASGFNVGMMSALVDINPRNEISGIMATYAAIMSLSQAAGFLLGGFIGYLSSKYVFLIQGISMILVSIAIKLLIEPTNEQLKSETGKIERPKFIWDIILESEDSKKIFTPWVKTFLAITFFVGISYSGYNNAFNYYLKAELEMKPIVNGIWKAVIGIVGLLANLTISVYIMNKRDSKKSLSYLLAFNTLAAFLVFFNNSLIPFFIFSFLFFIIYTIQVPILQDFAVEDSAGDAGFMSGIFNAFKSLGEMIGSTSAGLTYNISSKAPFLLGALALLMAFILSLFSNLKSGVKKA